MPCGSKKQVLAGLDKRAGRALGKSSKDYRREVVRPMVGRIKKSKSLKGLLRQLGPGLLREMKTDRFETGLAETLNQAELIGAASATPRK